MKPACLSRPLWLLGTSVAGFWVHPLAAEQIFFLNFGDMGEATVRGRGSVPSHLLVQDIDLNCCGLPTLVGFGAPGQLKIQDGAFAFFNGGGLEVGAGAQGLVLISGQNAPPGSVTEVLSVGEVILGNGGEGVLQLTDGGRMFNTGDFKVGNLAQGTLQLTTNAALTNTGDFKIGLGVGLPSGKVTLDLNSTVDVNGTLSVGPEGDGLLDMKGGSRVECDTLLVGGAGSQASGTIRLADFSFLKINQNAQVGTAPGGFGVIFLGDATAVLSIDGTMTIGNPGGGPGGGAVDLGGIDARIVGTGRIVVNPNGSLIGTGMVAVIKVDAGGIIRITPTGVPSPNAAAATKATADGHIAALVSPRTLTIEGDYEQLPTGVLVIVYAGLNPGEFDVLHVTGQTTLGGRLEVHFRGGFSPDDPATFIQSQDFVEADQGTTGDYAERIYAFPDIFADFDGDGDKDLSDVAAFQNCFGLSGGALEPACGRADWEDNGVLNEVEVRELTARLSGPQ